MDSRNLSPQRMFELLAADHQPTNAYSPEKFSSVAQWQSETLPKVVATVGDFPGRVPANPEMIVEWEHDGLRKQRWIIDVGKHISASFLVNIPLDASPDDKLPAILCWHGHGPFGKEPVMGNDSSPDLRTAISNHGYDYGHQMAKAGFVTYAIDWIGAGERNDANKPHFRSVAGGRDWCNLLYLHATMLGMTSISINVTHGMAATDFACTLPNVDPDRLGVMGLSGGGTMTTWTYLLDTRFKAAEIICYTDLWACFGIRDINYCGMQVTPGLYKLVDLPDLQGLVAPRPLLIDIGIYDTCFHIDSSIASYKKIEQIYKAADAADKLELDLFPSEHSWAGNKSRDFFGKHL